MMGTLVERLRTAAELDWLSRWLPLFSSSDAGRYAGLLSEAAARIEQLEAEAATLKARHEPNLPESAVSKGELQTARWDKVQAIKAYRARVGCSLREAAHAIDAALSAQRGGE